MYYHHYFHEKNEEELNNNSYIQKFYIQEVINLSVLIKNYLKFNFILFLFKQLFMILK